MPKMKSHSGAKKRFKVTGTGKLMRGCGFNSHLNSGRSGNMKRKLGGTERVHEGHARNYRRFMGLAKLNPVKLEARRALAAKAKPAEAAAA